MDRRPNSLSMTTGALRHQPLTGAQLMQAYGSPAGAGTTSPTRRGIAAQQRNQTDHVALLLGGSGAGMAASPLLARRSTPMQRTSSMPASGYRGAASGGIQLGGGGLTPGSRASSFAASTPQSIGAMLRDEKPLASTQASPQSASASAGGSASGNAQALTFSNTVLHSTGKTSNKPISLVVGSGCTQGFRPTMEDAHFELLHAKQLTSGDTVSIVGILDGHCGRRVADLGAHMVPDIFLSHPMLNSNIPQALVDAVALSDKAIFQQLHGDDGGSTLITAAIHGRTLTVANLGDARCVLCEGNMAIPMSVDHKPTDTAEQQRVRRCGGTVQLGRVGGCLAVSRALGDFEFKIQGATFIQREFQVSNIADIRQITLTDAARFLILACDGLWDVMSNEEAVTWVSQYLSRANIPNGATEASLRTVLNGCATTLCEYAVQKGSMDNVSVVLVLFHAWAGR